ncbi:MAG: hypothetical protein F6J92_28260 [Symploca sp. SIO1A3]|nr:hypothetical protein [Symploca sp. SIO1A3]
MTTYKTYKDIRRNFSSEAQERIAAGANQIREELKILRTERENKSIIIGFTSLRKVIGHLSLVLITNNQQPTTNNQLINQRSNYLSHQHHQLVCHQ